MSDVIETTDIKIYLSGGATNTDPNASLGGIISSTELVDNNLTIFLLRLKPQKPRLEVQSIEVSMSKIVMDIH